jgi:hypothetical protein
MRAATSKARSRFRTSTLRLSLHQHLVVLLPFALLCAFQPSPALAGGVAGIVLLMLLHAAWIVAWRRKVARDASTADPR